MTTPDPGQFRAPAAAAESGPPPAADLAPGPAVVWPGPVAGLGPAAGPDFDDAGQALEPKPGRGRFALVASAVAVVLVAFGGAIGWVWYEIAPRLPVLKDGGGLSYATVEPEEPIASDSLYVLLGLGVGIVAAVLVWFLLRRYRGVVVLAALTIGSLGAGVLAVWVGHWIAVHEFTPVGRAAPDGSQLDVPVMFLNRLWKPRVLNGAQPPPSGLIASQAFAAAFVYTALAGFSSYADLGRRRARPQPAPTDDAGSS